MFAILNRRLEERYRTCLTLCGAATSKIVAQTRSCFELKFISIVRMKAEPGEIHFLLWQRKFCTMNKIQQAFGVKEARL